MKIAVIGASGQLGVEIADTLSADGHEVVPLGHDRIEISDRASVEAVLGEIRPEAVINTAAMHNVEACEADPAASFAVNGLGNLHLADVCHQIGAYYLTISTDYVFDGKKAAPYVESDLALPLNVYGNTKFSGECFTLARNPGGAVLRVSGIYGSSPCRAKGGMNFVKLMLKLAAERPEIRVVDDEILTPTYAADIARQVQVLVERREAGLFHGTAQGQCSWYEFAREVFDVAGVSANLQKARPGEFPAKVARPNYSVLENRALKERGIDVMPSWKDGLRRYIALLPRAS